MQLTISQEVKNEIDRNIKLRLKLGELIKSCGACCCADSGHSQLKVIIGKDFDSAVEDIDKVSDSDSELRESLLEIAKSPKGKKKENPNIAESERKCLEILCNEFKTTKYSFDDLNCYISRVRANSILVGAFYSVNDKNEDYFSDDSDELKELIKSVYFEFKALSNDEIKKYFVVAEKDKYLLYIYDRADFLTGVQNALSGY